MECIRLGFSWMDFEHFFRTIRKTRNYSYSFFYCSISFQPHRQLGQILLTLHVHTVMRALEREWRLSQQRVRM